jgi:hypothetical protein
MPVSIAAAVFVGGIVQAIFGFGRLMSVSDVAAGSGAFDFDVRRLGDVEICRGTERG